MASFESQRQVQEFSKGIDRLGPEPGEQTAASAPCAEDAGKQLIGGQVIGGRKHVPQKFVSGGKSRTGLPAGPEFRPQASFPVVGEFEQFLFGQADYRALEYRRQGEVVLGKKQKPAQRQQIHDRDVLGEHQPVDSRDIDAQCLERAHQIVHESAAAPDQNHDVAGGDRTAPGFEHLAIADHPGDAGGDDGREPGLRRSAPDPLDRRFPALGLIRVQRRNGRPQLHETAGSLAGRLVHDRAVIQRHAVPGRDLFEYGVHGAKNRVDGSEGNIQVHVRPSAAGAGDLSGQPIPYRGEIFRCGALETENRLLDVTNREHGAIRLTGPLAGKKFVDNRIDDGPLIRAGVLSLVDQDMIETAVELVEDPGRDTGTREKPPGIENQILVVEERPGPLFPLIGIDEGP